MKFMDCPYMRTFFAAAAFAVFYYFMYWLFMKYYYVGVMDQYKDMMRLAEDPIMKYGMPMAVFVFGFIFSHLYMKFYSSLCAHGFMKGMKFGFYMWLLFAVGMGFIQFTHSVVPSEMMVVWLFHMLLSFVGGGFFVGLVFGHSPEECMKGHCCHEDCKDMKK